MLYVAISRVKHAADIHFIGKRDQVMISYTNIIQKPSSYSRQIAKNLSVLNVLEKPINLKESVQIYEYERPSPIGFVYMIISSKYPDLAYIGSTKDFANRLDQHNSPSGGTLLTSEQAYKPWIPIILIAGFPGHPDSRENINSRERLERLWQKKLGNNKSILKNQLCKTTDAITAASNALQELKQIEPIIYNKVTLCKFSRIIQTII
jgi:hypothetical protein